MAEEENNKTIIAEIGKNISSAIGTFKKSILKISGSQDKSATKFIKKMVQLCVKRSAIVRKAN